MKLTNTTSQNPFELKKTTIAKLSGRNIAQTLKAKAIYSVPTTSSSIVLTGMLA